jgi:uncharacterized protein (TIGR03118 family)
LALAQRGKRSFLFATDFHNAKVDVFNDQYRLAAADGGFKDPSLPAHYAPFGSQNVGGKLVVTFAKQDADRHDEVDGPGLGFVDLFDAQGHMMKRLVSRGELDAPWGIALAPASFGPLGGDLLIGNFGNGWINAYDPTTGAFRGSLEHNGAPVVIDGLWGISFGNGAATQPADTLFFAAGPDHESHGQYGRIDVVSHH